MRACGLRSLRAKGFSMGLYFWCYKLELVILKLLTLKLVTFELWGSLGFPGPLSLCKKFERAERVAQGIPAKPVAQKLLQVILIVWKIVRQTRIFATI